MSSNGTRANKRGRMLEGSIAALLEEEYEQVASADFFDRCEDRKPVFSSQCRTGTDIYGKSRRVDFILYHPERWPDCLVIQCKWQASSGSVEQKYPFEVLSIEADGYECIVVLDGGGYSEGAEEWLRGQAGKGKLLHVMNLGEITRFHSKRKL